MGMENRTYWRGGPPQGYGGGGMHLALPKPTPAVKWLMIACGVMFVVQLVTGGKIEEYLAVSGAAWWQVWRYITFQFLHSIRDPFHLLFNMLGLYFFGPPLEQTWGTKRFLRFYLICGAVAGLAFAAMSFLPNVYAGYLIGASGGVYGLLMAVAVLFPQMVIILLFFPVPIRLAAIILFAVMGLTVLTGLSSGRLSPSFWSHVAHLGGAVCGLVWVIWGARIGRIGKIVADNRQNAAFQEAEKRLQKKRAMDQKVDAILEKIKQRGIGALSEKEKRILKEATEHQQRR